MTPHQGAVAIAYRDGVQRMLVYVPLAAGATWVMPVPARARDVRVSICQGFPRFSGHDAYWGARCWVHGFLMVARATQIYPMFFEFAFLPPRPHGGHSPWRQATIPREHLSVRVAKAGDPALPEGEGLLKPYLTGEHAFVVLTAKDEPAPTRLPRAACVYVEFPAPRPICPLWARQKGAQGIGLVYVMGYVRPVRPLGKGWSIKRDILSRFSPHTPARFKEGLPVERIAHTTFQYDAPAGWPARDIEFERHRPRGIAFAKSIESLSYGPFGSLLTALAVAGFLAYVSAGLAGLLLHRRWWGYARLGLWTCLTVVGMGLVLAYQTAHPAPGRAPRFRSRGAAIGFCVLFSAIFVALSVVAQYALWQHLKG